MSQTAGSATQPPATIEALRRRHSDLSARHRIGLGHYERGKKDLSEQRQAAREQFGTDDPAELRRVHQQRVEANAAATTAYAVDLDAYEAALQKVEAALGAADPTGGMK